MPAKNSETFSLDSWVFEPTFLDIVDERLSRPPSDEPTEIEARLCAPFREYKTRSGGMGSDLCYITSRQAQRRLDEVFGAFGWSDRYFLVGDVLFCEIEVRVGDLAIRKSDSGGYKEMTTYEKVDGVRKQVTDEENTDKTGSSDAFKRAAVKLGVFRYGYKDKGVPQRVVDTWAAWWNESAEGAKSGE